MDNLRVLVTGANGFVGVALCRSLQRKGFTVVTAVRKNATCGQYAVGDISILTDWSFALEGCTTVIHVAARVHVLNETALDALTAYRAVNLHGTLNLAHQAVKAGVRRFIFVSSIGVNGAETFQQSFSAEDGVAPHSPYAVSKSEAEQGLQALGSETGMEVVIIRPPLVYGPNAPGNFGSLMRWLQRGVPLPLGAIHNQRSLVSLDNLIDLIVTCIKHPAAAYQTFLVSDGEDVSTTELLQRMGRFMNRPARLIPVPASWLKLAATLVGRRDVAQRLCGSLQVDIEKTQRLLGWRPPLTLDEGLRIAAGNRVNQ